jgi:quercetin dioxygenase-like cupin family protein
MTQPRYHVEHLRATDVAGEPPDGLQAGGHARAVSAERLGEVFLAPWRAVSLVELGPGAALGPRELDASEAMIYVTGGAGVAHLGHGPVELREGIALTLFKEERLHVVAGEDGAGLELFFAEIGTERPSS